MRFAGDCVATSWQALIVLSDGAFHLKSMLLIGILDIVTAGLNETVKTQKRVVGVRKLRVGTAFEDSLDSHFESRKPLVARTSIKQVDVVCVDLFAGKAGVARASEKLGVRVLPGIEICIALFFELPLRAIQKHVIK